MSPALILAAALVATPPKPDTVRVEVGSAAVDARVYKPHRARVRVHDGGPTGPVTNEWVNELTLGDSAGRPVMRWTTTSMIGPQAGNVLSQTYDGVTMAPIAYLSRQKSGAYVQYRIEGSRVIGSRRGSADTVPRPIDLTVDRHGFFAGASDLVPLAVGMRPGLVIVAPVWNLAMAKADDRAFTIVGREPTLVEGRTVNAWKVDEHRVVDRSLVATWYLVDESPYMVAGEMYRADGGMSYASEIALPSVVPATAPPPRLASRGTP